MDKLTKTEKFKIIADNNRTITIDPVHLHYEFGGEGLIYKVGNDIIKLYKKDNYLKNHNYESKIGKLARLDPKHICYPTSMVTNLKNQLVGVRLPYVVGTTLHEAQSNVFWKSQRFNLHKAQKVISALWDVTTHAHEQGFIMADPNLLNWMIDPKNKFFITAIDIEAWRHDEWKPNAVSPSIRDFSVKDEDYFTQATDWYSWAVVAFCLITGAHPYSGAVEGYKRGDTESRARDRVSLFSPKIKRINKNVRMEFPKKLEEYFRSVFEEGAREVPDKSIISSKTLTKGIAVRPSVSSTSVKGPTNAVFKLISDTIEYTHLLGGKAYSDNYIYDITSNRGEVRNNKEFVFNGNAKITRTQSDRISIAVEKEVLPVYSDWARIISERLFNFFGGTLYELKLFKIKKGWILQKDRIGAYTNNELVAFKDCFLRKHGSHSSLLVPYMHNDIPRTKTIKLPFDNSFRVLSVSASKEYAKVECVDKSGAMFEYDIHLYNDDVKIKQIDTRIGPMCQLSNGVAVWLNEDNDLTIYSTRAQVKSLLKVGKKDITSLTNFNGGVYATADKKLYKVSSP